MPSPTLAQDAAPVPPPAEGITPDEVQAIARSQQAIEGIEAWFREAERARQAGNCEEFYDLLEGAATAFPLAAPLVPEPIRASTRAEWERRRRAALQLPCPPPGVQPPPPATNVTPSIATPPSSALLELLRAELRRAASGCDEAALQAVKDRLLEELDTLLVNEFDEGRRGQLEREMFEVRRTTLEPCDSAEDILGELGIGAGIGQASIPSTGLGFSGQQQENFAARSEDDIDVFHVGGFFDFGFLKTVLRAWVDYMEGDASNSLNRPATNQSRFGAVYTAPSPSGTSGVQLQQLGMQATTQVELRSFGAGIQVPIVRLPLRTAEAAPPRPVDRVFFAYTSFERLERKHGATIDSSAVFFGNTFFFAQQRVQALDENYFGAGVGGRLALPLGSGFRLNLGGRAGPYYRSSELESVEQVQSNVVPAADRDFTIALEDDDSGVGVDGELLFEVEHALRPDFTISAGARAGYRSNVGSIFNPSSSVQLLDQDVTTHVESEDMWWWRVQAGVTLRFGPGR